MLVAIPSPPGRRNCDTQEVGVGVWNSEALKLHHLENNLPLRIICLGKITVQIANLTECLQGELDMLVSCTVGCHSPLERS